MFLVSSDRMWIVVSGFWSNLHNVPSQINGNNGEWSNTDDLANVNLPDLERARREAANRVHQRPLAERLAEVRDKVCELCNTALVIGGGVKENDGFTRHSDKAILKFRHVLELGCNHDVCTGCYRMTVHSYLNNSVGYRLGDGRDSAQELVDQMIASFGRAKLPAQIAIPQGWGPVSQCPYPFVKVVRGEGLNATRTEAIQGYNEDSVALRIFYHVTLRVPCPWCREPCFIAWPSIVKVRNQTAVDLSVRDWNVPGDVGICGEELMIPPEPRGRRNNRNDQNNQPAPVVQNPQNNEVAPPAGQEPVIAPDDVRVIGDLDPPGAVDAPNLDPGPQMVPAPGEDPLGAFVLLGPVRDEAVPQVAAIRREQARRAEIREPVGDFGPLPHRRQELIRLIPSRFEVQAYVDAMYQRLGVALINGRPLAAVTHAYGTTFTNPFSVIPRSRLLRTVRVLRRVVNRFRMAPRLNTIVTKDLYEFHPNSPGVALLVAGAIIGGGTVLGRYYIFELAVILVWAFLLLVIYAFGSLVRYYFQPTERFIIVVFTIAWISIMSGAFSTLAAERLVHAEEDHPQLRGGNLGVENNHRSLVTTIEDVTLLNIYISLFGRTIFGYLVMLSGCAVWYWSILRPATQQIRHLFLLEDTEYQNPNWTTLEVDPCFAHTTWNKRPNHLTNSGLNSWLTISTRQRYLDHLALVFTSAAADKMDTEAMVGELNLRFEPFIKARRNRLQESIYVMNAARWFGQANMASQRRHVDFKTTEQLTKTTPTRHFY